MRAFDWCQNQQPWKTLNRVRRAGWENWRSRLCRWDSFRRHHVYSLRTAYSMSAAVGF